MGDPVQGMPLGPLGHVEPPVADEPDGETRPPGASTPAVVYATAAAVVLADQATKLAAAAWLQPLDSVPLVGRWVSLTWATNTGGAFGVLPSATGLLVAIAVVVVAVLVLLARYLIHSPLLGLSVACLLGGALGNLIDRVRLGYVIDFIDLHFWPVFNVADIAITVGAGLLVIAALTAPAPAHSEASEDE